MFFTRYADLALAALVILVVGMMVVPLPPFVLDLAISFNIAISVTLLLVALYVGDALEIGTFPTLLLLSTLFRLALEVSATRLILLRGHAGDVIHAFGNFVVAGNLVVGAVIFLVLTFIQFVVISKGAERVAEVGARFVLDAMPGKQLAIDADLRAGHTDREEAQRRRALLARESQFFGAMDGAMKFVKGDAIAGLVVVATNIVGGLIIGIVQRDLDVATAVRTYTLLTIGQGLVAQIPALIVSTAAGLLVTRVSSEEEGGQLGREVGRQLLAQPKALGVAGALLAVLALVPGLPALPFVLLAALFGFVAFRLRNGARAPLPVATTASPVLAPVVIEVPAGLEAPLEAAIPAVRDRVFQETGIPMPAVSIRTAARNTGSYAVQLREVPVARGRTDDAAVIGEELFEVMRRHGHELFGIEESQALVAALARTHPSLVREVVPKLVPPVVLAEVLRRLAEEGISLRALPEVLGALAEWAPREKDAAALTERVRSTLRRQITFKHAAEGTISVYSLDPMIEDAVREAIATTNGTTHLALEPALTRDIVQAVGRTIRVGSHAVVLTAADIRPHVRRLLETEHPRITVLSPRELTPETKLEQLGRISVS